MSKLILATCATLSTTGALAFETPATYDNIYADDYAAYAAADGANHLTNYVTLRTMGNASSVCASVGITNGAEWPGSYWEELASLAADELGEVAYDPIVTEMIKGAKDAQWERLEQDTLSYITYVCPTVKEPEFVAQ